MVRPSLSWKASYTVGVNVFLLHLVRILCQEDSAILNGAVKVCSGLEIHFMQKIFLTSSLLSHFLDWFIV